MGIPLGAELRFTEADEYVEVTINNQVKYQGEVLSLSAITRQLRDLPSNMFRGLSKRILSNHTPASRSPLKYVPRPQQTHSQQSHASFEISPQEQRHIPRDTGLTTDICSETYTTKHTDHASQPFRSDAQLGSAGGVIRHPGLSAICAQFVLLTDPLSNASA